MNPITGKRSGKYMTHGKQVLSKLFQIHLLQVFF